MKLRLPKKVEEKPAAKTVGNLSKGIFWVIADEASQLVEGNIVAFKIYCDKEGNPVDLSDCNSKSGLSLNHKLTWEQIDSKFCKNKQFDFYPRGRVEIVRGKATIWLNQNVAHLTNEIKKMFDLSQLDTQVKIDGTKHYQCHFDNDKSKF